jgi:hypothetical protein
LFTARRQPLGGRTERRGEKCLELIDGGLVVEDRWRGGGDP